MCNCKNLKSQVTPVEAEEFGLVSNYWDVTKGVAYPTGRLEPVSEIYGCCLYRCLDCGQLWEAVLDSSYFLRAANKPLSQLRRSDYKTDRDPSANRGVILRKQYGYKDVWEQDMKHRYEAYRKPALEKAVREYESRGYSKSSGFRESWWDLAVVRRQVPKKQLFGEELLEEAIWIFVDVDGRVMYEKVVSKGLEILEQVRYNL
jgi:hypothetical protein